MGPFARHRAQSLAPRKKEGKMFIGIAIILAIAWLLGFTMFHVAGFAIHLLLIAAIISVIVHFVSGGRTRTA
jgi:hypothetical protein